MVNYRKIGRVLGITAGAAMAAGAVGYGAWRVVIKPLKHRYFDSNAYHLKLTNDREPNKNLLNSTDLEGARDEKEGDYGVAKDLETTVDYQFAIDVPQGAKLRRLVLGTPSQDGKSLDYIVRAELKEDGTLDTSSPFDNADLKADVDLFFHGKPMRKLSRSDKGTYFGFAVLDYGKGTVEKEYFELSFNKEGNTKADVSKFEEDDISFARKVGLLKTKPVVVKSIEQKFPPVEAQKLETKDAGAKVESAEDKKESTDAGQPSFKMEFHLETPDTGHEQ